MRGQKFGHANGDGGQSYGQQLAEIHANTLPGVTRPEEGEAMLANDDLEAGSMPNAQRSLQKNYNERERSRERERYEDYLDEQDSDKLPNAFDLGWRRNLLHLFGDRPLLWWLPFCNTSGDGWHWEPNAKWVEAREALRRQREDQWQEELDRGRTEHGSAQRVHHGYPQKWPGRDDSERHYLTTSNGVITVPGSGTRSPNKADLVLGRTDEYFDRSFDEGSPSSRMSMKTLRRRGSFSGSDDDDDNYIVSSDDERRMPGASPPSAHQRAEGGGQKQD